jgi:beta-lactamase regulating signal transducer with metallopeptidase domain
VSLDPLWLEWTRALGWTLIHTLWQGALVAAAWGAFRLSARGADVRLRYGTGLLALALLLLLPALTLWRLAPGADDAALAAGASTAFAADWMSQVESLLPLVVAGWLLGVLLMAAREAWRWHAVRALLLGSASPLPEWTARAARIATRLRVTRPVRVVSSTLALTPSLVGWLKPVVVLPASTLLALSPRQLEMVIAHELAHVRRADYLVNLLQVAVETLLFHHPAVHWISRDVRELREACCDDLVLRSGVDPLHYADTLACLAELRGITHAPALAASGGSLLLRVRRIVGVGADAPPRTDGQLLALCAGLLAFALLLAGNRAPAPEPAAPAVAIEALSRNAMATVAAALAPPVAPRMPAVAPTAPAAAQTRPGVQRAGASADAMMPAQAAVASPAASLPAPRIDLVLPSALGDAGAAPAPPDLRLRRTQIRPRLVIVNDPPIDCVRSVGSRLCRPLPLDGSPEAADGTRSVVRDGREALRDGLLGASSRDGIGP